MPVFNFTILGSVKVPEGVSENDINIEVSTPGYTQNDKEVKVTDKDWDIHEISLEED